MKKISFTKNPVPANRIDSMFLSETCFGMELREFASIFVPWYRTPRFFSSAERFRTEFPEFSVPRNGSERNSESFLFRGTAGIPPELTKCSVYSVFRGIIFCRKLPTLCLTTLKFSENLFETRGIQKLPMFY